MRSVQLRYNNWLRLLLGMLLVAASAIAQAQLANYLKVKDGKFLIHLQKQISNDELKSFTEQHELYDLPLRQWMEGKQMETISKMGWQVLENDDDIFVIARQLKSFGAEDLPPGDRRIAESIFAVKLMEDGLTVPRHSFGVNRYKRRADFAVRDSVVTFHLPGETNARRVMLAGSFSKWQLGAFAMKKTDSGWIANVLLPPGKHWYKFIVDGRWMTDPNNLQQENDGAGNMNSVYFKTNAVFRLAGFTSARNVSVAGSFNSWVPRKLNMYRNSKGWYLPVFLPDGTHTYRFMVDEQWMEDPANKDRLPNEFHEYNSVLRIGKTYQFKLNGFPNARQVILTGSFNNWRMDELFMKKQGNTWIIPYHLGAGNHEYKYLVDGKLVGAGGKPGTDKDPGYVFVLQPNHTFRLKGYASASQVVLSGDFIGWSTRSFSMHREGNDWILKVFLQPGKHLYKFLVDGKWITDPANPDWEQNEYHTKNSVLWFDGEGR